ncbi:MAG TPA: hypothetical protein VHH10_15715 [Rubrobacteraceae bacterium]|nr:hypothetical protein [Rubrobacteraceae bacterium]
MERDKENEYLSRMRQFLQEKLDSRDVAGGSPAVVRRHELEEIAVTVGLDRQRAWHLFQASEGHVWRGHYIRRAAPRNSGTPRPGWWGYCIDSPTAGNHE